jgi:hypothetical protein
MSATDTELDALVAELREQRGNLESVFVLRQTHPAETDGLYYSEKHSVLLGRAADAIESLLKQLVDLRFAVEGVRYWATSKDARGTDVAYAINQARHHILTILDRVGGVGFFDDRQAGKNPGAGCPHGHPHPGDESCLATGNA